MEQKFLDWSVFARAQLVRGITNALNNYVSFAPRSQLLLDASLAL